MELHFYDTNGGAQLTAQALEALFAHLDLPFDSKQLRSKSENARKAKHNLRNDFAYKQPSFPKKDNRASLNFFCPAIK